MSHATSASTPDLVSDGADVAGPSGAQGQRTATADRAGVSTPLPQGNLDQLARRVLGLRDAEPRALMDLQGSLVLSAVRCLITYVFIPIALPAIAWAGIVARPLGFALAIVAVAMSVRSLRRVWQANWTHRWAYTAFIAVVVGLLLFSIVLDLRFFLA